MTKTYKNINQPIVKKDAMQLLLGKPVYVEDIMPEDCLVVKVLRSTIAHGMIDTIDVEDASKVVGIEAIYTYKDVPQSRFTMAGQTYPEPSPYDRLILDKHIRHHGEAVAIIAGNSEDVVDTAMQLIKVTYNELPIILDLHDALDNEVLIHPESSWKTLANVGSDNARNLVATGSETNGEIEAVFDSCDVVLKRTYHTKANNQAMMETFRTFCKIDTYGRLHVVSSTQIVFHARRILATALEIPKSMVRVEKPRIGGGFGAKQSIVAEVYPAFVTWMTKKPSRIIYSRVESQIAASPRHEMEVTVKIGANNDGTIRAIDVYTLSNTGAYGEHGPTTVGLSGHKSIPLYNNNLEAHKFAYDVVYTNVQSSGAYRGYGATQGIFAVESIVNELASILNIDAVDIREKNMVRQGQTMPAYYNEVTTSCTLDKCMEKAKELFDWKTRSKPRIQKNGNIRSAGVAMAMQGSGISHVDVGSVTLKVNDDGFYTLLIGAADMGTGCDTILGQMVGEHMNCSVDNVIVFGADTDISPYDSGSYASSTTYVTGKAVEKACKELTHNICSIVASMHSVDVEQLTFDGQYIYDIKTDIKVSLQDVATKSMCGNTIPLQVTATHTSPVSPPPYMVGMVEVEIDKDTGDIEIIDYVAVVDCGTVINSNLARVQVEGGLVQGIGMALYENIQYSPKGTLTENSLMQYKLPTRIETGDIRVDFVSSYEETGPFGAKSIGEIVINTPSPALAHAIYNATGCWHRTLPITGEDIAMNSK